MEIWIVVCAAGMLLARAGLALYTCGLVRAKNSGGSLLRHVADLCIAVLVFWAAGIAIYSPAEPCRLIRVQYLFGLRGDDVARLAPEVFLMLAATLLASGVVVGSLSERSRFWPSMAPAVLLAALVPALAKMSFSYGLLGRIGFHDFAGGSFIHLAAGMTALAAIRAVGDRNGKYNRDGSSNVIPGHSLPLAGGGVMFIFVAWFPYLLAFGVLAGKPVGMIGLNTLLAVAAAGAASLAVSHFRYGKPDIWLTLSGVLGGLVAMTAGADSMSNLCAVLTGAVAGVLIPTLIMQEDLIWRLDDPTGAVVIHGVGGAWGIVAAGLFSAPAAGMGRLKFLGAQLLGLLAIAIIVFIAATLLFFVLKKLVALRARDADEFDGLDLAEHDIGSYPDFQQNTIKSYHLRET